MPGMSSRQIAPAVLMIRPAAFGFNAETAAIQPLPARRRRRRARRARRPGARNSMALLPRCAPRASRSASSRTRRFRRSPTRSFPTTGSASTRTEPSSCTRCRPRAGGRNDVRTSCRRWPRSSASRCDASSTSRTTKRDGRYLEGTGSLVLDRCGAPRLRLPFAAHRRGAGARSGRSAWTTSSCCSMRAGPTARRPTIPT